MSARVNDELLTTAAEALIEVAKSMTNKQGLRIVCPMDLQRAKSAVLATMVWSIGYPSAVMPTGWIEIDGFGERK